MNRKLILAVLPVFVFMLLFALSAEAWNDETHLAISKAAGYRKWYNSAAADITKIKAGKIEENNHYSNTPKGVVVTPEMVLSQVDRYNTRDRDGHLYGAIIASLRAYREEVARGKYGEYHLAFCAHYVGDLSQPLHNTAYNDFNRKFHKTIDGIVNGEILANWKQLTIRPIVIRSERDLAMEITKLANQSVKLGYTLEAENRLPTKEEVYSQLGWSASLLKAILDYVKP